MERRVSILFGFVVGIVFTLLPVNREIFEGFQGVVEGLLYIIGFLCVVIFGGALIYDAFRNLKSNWR